MKIRYSFSLLLFFSFNISSAQTINASYIKKHIKFLADDKLKGRGTATQEELTAANYIRNHFSTLKLEPRGNINSYYYSYKFRKSEMQGDTSGPENASAINVAAYLDNREENTVIIGAHYDHLGFVVNDSKNIIFNGADDNASGVAGVLELARYFSRNRRKEKFNFLFICFSGEELGCRGSKKFCEKPTIDLAKVNYMFNLDMIGRLNDTTKELMVSGTGTATDWIPLLNKVSMDMKINKDSSGLSGSDHTSFYFKNIPVLCFSTSLHADYHKPADDVAKINFAGEKKVLEYIIRIIEETESLPKIQFLKTGETKNEICKSHSK